MANTPEAPQPEQSLLSYAQEAKEIIRLTESNPYVLVGGRSGIGKSSVLIPELVNQSKNLGLETQIIGFRQGLSFANPDLEKRYLIVDDAERIAPSVVARVITRTNKWGYASTVAIISYLFNNMDGFEDRIRLWQQQSEAVTSKEAPVVRLSDGKVTPDLIKQNLVSHTQIADFLAQLLPGNLWFLDEVIEANLQTEQQARDFLSRKSQEYYRSGLINLQESRKMSL